MHPHDDEQEEHQHQEKGFQEKLSIHNADIACGPYEMALRASMALWLNEPSMGIVTKTGDTGMTALMFNRRVPKTHPRVEAYGTVDELNCAIGLARATADDTGVQERLRWVQQDLVALMGELATAREDHHRFVNAGLARLTPEMTSKLDRWIEELESKSVRFHGWATPGATLHSAALEVARTVCRRAERRVCTLQESAEVQNAEIAVFLNRLSDLLWLLARSAEPPPPSQTQLT